MPSTADSTEIAGVIMESPRNIAAPSTPITSSSLVRWPNARRPSAISDSEPPSPWLSARSSSSTYFAVTTMISAHRISDSTPSTMGRLDGAALGGAQRRLAKRVEWRRSDVAVDDADAAQRQSGEAALLARLKGNLGGGLTGDHANDPRFCPEPTNACCIADLRDRLTEIDTRKPEKSSSLCSGVIAGDETAASPGVDCPNFS